jgi:hypothetical protein
VPCRVLACQAECCLIRKRSLVRVQDRPLSKVLLGADFRATATLRDRRRHRDAIERRLTKHVKAAERECPTLCSKRITMHVPPGDEGVQPFRQVAQRQVGVPVDPQFASRSLLALSASALIAGKNELKCRPLLLLIASRARKGRRARHARRDRL